MKRMAWLLLGFVMVGLGIIGALLPVMPTTIFLILAVGCFARSSPELEAKLLGHPRYGAALRAWSEEGAISRNGKCFATLGMGLGTTLFWLGAKPSWVLGAGVTLAICLCALWIQTRPLPRVEQRLQDQSELRTKLLAHALSWGGHALVLYALLFHWPEPSKPTTPEQIRVQLTFLSPTAPPVPMADKVSPERFDPPDAKARPKQASPRMTPERVRMETFAQPQLASLLGEVPVFDEGASNAPSVPSPPPPSAPQSLSLPPSPQTSGEVDPNWEGEVLTRLEKFKRYPRRAKVRRQEGIVLIHALIDGSGRVMSATVRRTSGSNVLDQEALATFARAEPLPAPPIAMRAPVSLDVPVRFFLR